MDPKQSNGTVKRKYVNAATGSNQAQYSHDTHSVDQEIISNVEEVHRFNEELAAYTQKGHFLQEGRIAGNERTFPLPRPEALDLITSMIGIVREPLLVLDNNLSIKKANRAFYRTFGHSEKETEGRVIYEVGRNAWDSPILRELLEKVLLDHRAYEEVEIEIESSPLIHKTLRLNVRRLSGGEMILMSIRDVTPRRRAEVELYRVRDELRQGQKMEAIGRLAGGVAHDFNNILTAISGFSELLLDKLEPGSDVVHLANEIKNASARAAALTQQLLAFSRRQVLQPQTISLNSVILGLDELLRRLIGDDIEFGALLGETLGPIHADPGQISQVVLNLALNARDAMPNGGKLSHPDREHQRRAITGSGARAGGWPVCKSDRD